MKITASQLRRIIKEEVAGMTSTVKKDPQRFLHGFESGHPIDDEGYMVKLRMANVKETATTICSLLDEEDQLPSWVQDLVASAYTDLEHVKDYLVGDEKLRSYKTQSSTLDVSESGLMKNRDEKFMKPLKPPTATKCVQCGKKLLSIEKDAYEAEGGAGYPDVCMDCAEETSMRESFRRGLTLEGHNRITPEEMSAWMSGDWGYVSESNPYSPPRGGKLHKNAKPGDPASLADFIRRNPDFLGAAQDMGVDLKSDEMREYVGDNLAGQYSSADIDAAWKFV